MTKKSKIILGLAIIVVIVGIVAFWPKEEKTKTTTDSKVIIPNQVVTNYGTSTGAKEISLTPQQYTEVYLIKTLRNSSPIIKTYFSLDFDYGVNKFIVKYVDAKKGAAEFEKWLNDTGYKAISKEYFQIQ